MKGPEREKGEEGGAFGIGIIKHKIKIFSLKRYKFMV